MDYVQKLLKLVRAGSNVCIDSRQARTGDIFFSLRGEHHDGNRFAASALESGCQLAVIDQPAYDAGPGYLLVDDSLDLLQALSQAYRAQWNMPVLAITGSNGKTTTKELINAALSPSFNAFTSKGNLNNHIGLPLSLLSMRQPLDMAILEMGANHPGEIARLCQIARPTYGLITNIGKAHLEGFGSIEGVAAAKGELYEHIHNTGGLLFVNTNDERLKVMSEGHATIRYGSGPDNHCSARVISASPTLRISFETLRAFGQAEKGISGEISTQLTGAYNLDNVLAAVTVGLFFGVPAWQLIRSIGDYVPKNHRSQIIQRGSNTIVMDAYNANPTSMAAALDNFASFSGEKKAVFLGDMLELGPDTAPEHEKLYKRVKQSGFQLMVFVGKHFCGVCRKDGHQLAFEQVGEASRWLKERPLDGYSILIKGSRGIQMEELLPYV